MSKVTLLWFTHPDRPFKVLSFKKGTIYFLLGCLVFFCLATLVLFCSSWIYQDKLSHYQKEKKQLQTRLAQLERNVKDLKSTISTKNSSIQELEKKLSHSQKQLRQIQDMELKIRNYLGLEREYEDSKEQSHQGAFKNYNSSSTEIKSQVLPDNYPQDVSAQKQDIVPFSLSLKKEIKEIVKHLKHKENKLNNVPSILPVQGENIWLTCGYEWRDNPFTSKKEFHSAIDVAGAHKTPIIAPADGKVIKASKNRIWGNHIRIKHNEKLTTAYGHLYSKEVSRGDKVERRDVIGYMGSSGHSTGTHLHYKVIENGKHTNPMKYVLDRKVNSLKLKEKYEEMAEK